MIKQVSITILLLIVTTRFYAQEVVIPDDKFREALLHLGVDTNGDGKIQTEEAQAVTTLNVSQAGITNLSGIDAFTNIDSLNCSSNELTTLDVSQNKQLKFLYCSINKLTQIKTSALSKLNDLYCSHNKLTDLDLSGDTALKVVDCGYNQLATLDLSSNTRLETLECYMNVLDTLNLSKNTRLTILLCGNNKLRYLDLSACPQLTWVDCQYNTLQHINLLASTKLARLACYSNNLAGLDVTSNKLLAHLDCGKNFYTYLDLSKNDSLQSLDCSQTPNLKYICVKDTATVSSNFYFLKDDHTQWSQSCNTTNGTPEIHPYAVNVYPNPGSDYFRLTLPQKAKVRIIRSNGSEVAQFADILHLEFGHDFHPGLYMVHVQFYDGKKPHVFKVIKE